MRLNCKDIDIEITSDAPFKEDKLNREQIAPILTTIADVYSDSGAVLAIDGEWGSGKTTFVKMWRQYLINNGYKTLYFNAWETDFIEDPLIALMGELKEVVGSNSKFESLVKNIGKIGLSVGGEILKTGVKRITGIDTDAIKVGIDEVADIFKEQIDSYNGRKAELEEFKNKLGEYVSSEAQDNTHPIVFFIDELDRCNPHYAVRLLERVKHLFEVPNIIFVLAVNIQQLQYAIQGYYGSENIDGQEYLKRFIDLSYTLPAPNLEDYACVLYETHSFDDFFNHNMRIRQGIGREGELFLNMAQDLISYSNVNLRLANKIFAYSRIVLQTYSINSAFPADLLFLLCFIKITNPVLYARIHKGEFSIQGLIDVLEEELPNGLFNPEPYSFTHRHLCCAVAALILRYNYTSRGIPREEDFKELVVDGKGNGEFPIQTKKFNKQMLDEALKYCSSNHRESYYEYGLKDMLGRIDLTSNLRI